MKNKNLKKKEKDISLTKDEIGQMISQIWSMPLSQKHNPFSFERKAGESGGKQGSFIVTAYEASTTLSNGCAVKIQVCKETEKWAKNLSEQTQENYSTIKARVRLTHKGVDKIINVEKENPTLEDCKKVAEREFRFILKYNLNFGIVHQEHLKEKEGRLDFNGYSNVLMSGGMYKCYWARVCVN